MRIYHISTYQPNARKKLFTPRVPEARLVKENETVKRICLSATLEGCLMLSNMTYAAYNPGNKVEYAVPWANRGMCPDHFANPVWELAMPFD